MELNRTRRWERTVIEYHNKVSFCVQLEGYTETEFIYLPIGLIFGRVVEEYSCRS